MSKQYKDVERKKAEKECSTVDPNAIFLHGGDTKTSTAVVSKNESSFTQLIITQKKTNSIIAKKL